MTESKHSETPWVVEPNGACYNLCSLDKAPHFAILAGMNYNEEGELDANAAFIVRAVNSHDALVEAVEKATGLIASFSSSNISQREKDYASEILSLLVAAYDVAKTKGGE